MPDPRQDATVRARVRSAIGLAVQTEPSHAAGAPAGQSGIRSVMINGEPQRSSRGMRVLQLSGQEDLE
jgi:hypothetical protein